MGQARSPTVDCYFNSFCKGRKNFISTPCYAQKLRAVRHSAESRLRAMPHSAELRLNAMPHSAEFQLRAMPHSAEF
jgi:hypothetical protein